MDSGIFPLFFRRILLYDWKKLGGTDETGGVYESEKRNPGSDPPRPFKGQGVFSGEPENLPGV